MSSSMLDQILPRAERFPAKFAHLRFLPGVYPDMNFHVLPPDQFSTNLASNLALPCMSPKVFLVTVTVERLEPAYLASILPPVLGLAVNLHVTPQVDPIPERLVTNLAGARLVVRVHAHVGLQGSLQIKPFVANLAELGELLVVPPYVYLQVIFRGELGAAHVAYVGGAVQRFMHVQVLLLLEHLVAHVALYRSDRDALLLLLLPLHAPLFRSIPVLPPLLLLALRRLFATTTPPMLEQLHLLRETLATRVAGVFLLGLSQRLPRTKDRPLGSVHQQRGLRVEPFVARLASIRRRLHLLLLLLLNNAARAVIDTILDNDKRSIFLIGRFSRGARSTRLGCCRLHVFRSAKRQHSVSLANRSSSHARDENQHFWLMGANSLVELEPRGGEEFEKFVVSCDSFVCREFYFVFSTVVSRGMIK